MQNLKTRHILLHPNQVKVHYLKPDGSRLTDDSEKALSYLFEVEFIGVNLNPLRVLKVIPNIMNYSKNSEAEVIVEYVDENVTLSDLSELRKHAKL